MSDWIMEALLLVIVVVPLVILFGYAVFDVIRRHGIGVAHKAIWLIVFCLVPDRRPAGLPGDPATRGDGSGGRARRRQHEPGGRAGHPRRPARPRQADRRGVPPLQGASNLVR